MFKQSVEQFLLETYGDEKGTLQLGNSSCEMLANTILEKFECYSVRVLEDNENGAHVFMENI